MTFLKPAHPWDEYFVQTEQGMQLAMHCKSPKSVPRILEKMNKIFMAPKLRIEDHKIFYTQKDMPVYKLPDTFKSLREAVEYMDIHHNPKCDLALAKVGANKDTIVINSSHCCTDGVYMSKLFDVLRDDIEVPEPTTVYNSFDLFENEIVAAEEHPDNDITNPALTRFTPKDTEFISTYEYAIRKTIKSEAKDLQCFDKEKQKPRGLTDHLYAMFVLAASAYDGKFEKFGLDTIINLRPYLKSEDTFNNGCLFAIFDVTAKNVTMETTIKEIMKQTRESFNEQIRRKMMWGWFKHLADEPDMNRAIPGVRLLVSNTGKFHLGGPFDDVLVDCTSRPQLGAPRLDIYHYAVIGEGRNDCISQFDFQYDTVSPREVDLFAKSIHWGLENIKLNTSWGDALSQMTEYQQKFIKTEFPKYLVKY